ncbi:peptidoglycan DD-metalloendopeptidase family protein [Rhodohalobacter halophilus]|uniref:peptidoglycan DD-metalloendopeptidase family protein n=1 Tax=Rhodohalobacter halophilus TaxID=1812810 RepID=UPI000A034744|nr:peptidoglycan DD-metalloendopeptidase family protein [Rhodohalobacter halophilus]
MIKTQTHPVMNLPDNYEVFDFSEGYDSDKMSRFVEKGGWGVGGYSEKRNNMYLTPQYENRRNIHMGIDIWAAAGEPVFAPLDGKVAYLANHDQEGNYGGTLVLEHKVNGQIYYALYGHLSPESISHLTPGQKVDAGAKVGELGNEQENGNWPPHLHYQISTKDPGEADMPGVVSNEEYDEALKLYPDPRIILGDIY